MGLFDQIHLITKKKIALFLCCLVMIALVFSHFLLSITMITLLLLAFINAEQVDNKYRFSINRKPLTLFSDYRKYLSFAVIPLFFGIVLFSFWQTTGDYNYFLERLRIKLPFLVLPFAFLGLPSFTKREVNTLLLFLMVLMTICSIWVGVNYLFHFDAVNLKLGRGQAMPTPRNHIRFSLLTAISIIGGIYLIIQKYYWKQPMERHLIKGLTIFLFGFLHVLSVKTGMVCLYFALGILTLRYMYFSKNYLLGIGFILTMLLIPFVAYKTIPSFKQKMNYVFYDYQQHLKGEGGQYADSGRIASLKTGYELFQRDIIFGVGAGNFRREVKKIFATKYDDYIIDLMPHNQFLFVLAGTGLFGFSFFMVAFFLPLFYKKAYQNTFFLGFYMIFLAAFILEHTIENAVGVGTFIFFLLLIMNMELTEE